MARIPRKVSPKSLENAALHYLERFSSTSENLRRILLRRVRRSAEHHGTDPAEGAEWIEGVLEKLSRLGYLDDRAFAEGRVASLRRRGDSGRKVRGKLLQKGVAPDLVDEVMAEEEEGADLGAAIALARRRRLGPWRSDREQRAERRERDLAALARAGFSFDLALRVIDAPTPEDLEEEASL